MIVLEIASANEDQDIAGLVIESNHRPLKILGGRLIGHGAIGFGFAKTCRVLRISLVLVIGMLFDPLKIRAKRMLSDGLKIDVDGRVNAKTFVHRAVPSDRGDHLLADVIDCVGLPLSVLPAANDNLFPSGTGASFATDEIKIAHAIERVIARLQ